MMNKIFLGPSRGLLTKISVPILTILVLSLSTSVYAQFDDFNFKHTLPGDHHGDNHPSEKNCKKSDTLEQISIKIDAEKCQMNNFKDYKKWDFYKLEDRETQNCLKFFHDLGNSLVDYEVVYCYASPEKYEQKEKNN